MSVTTELYANPAATAATVSSGGTTAPAAGTSQTWTMAGGYASFPAASSTASPPTFFRIIDPAAPAEIMFVTNVSGATWTVTRGAENTTPVAHAAGFTVEIVLSAGTLQALVQAARPQLNETVITGSANDTTKDVLKIQDNPAAQRTGAGQLVEILDHLGATIFAVGVAGGPKAFGDWLGCWHDVFTEAVALNPWGGVRMGGSSGPTVYAGAGVPLPSSITSWMGTFSAFAVAGDIYIQEAGPVWTCTTSGTAAAPNGTWTIAVPGGSGYGIDLPSAGITLGSAVSNTTATQTIAQLTIPAGEPQAGSVYEIETFGVYSTAAGTTPSLVFGVNWGGTATGSQAVGTGTGATNARWRAHAVIAFNSATQYTISVRVDVATTNTGATSVPAFMFGPTANNTVTTASAQALAMTLAWGTAAAGNTFTVYGGKIWKSA